MPVASDSLWFQNKARHLKSKTCIGSANDWLRSCHTWHSPVHSTL